MKTNSLSEIEAEIALTKNELQDVHGTEAEVYARIVGYYRSVRNWNKGKHDEYNHRKLYEITNTKIDSDLCKKIA
jgi:ribonucleoside-triphosphate reductase